VLNWPRRYVGVNSRRFSRRVDGQQKALGVHYPGLLVHNPSGLTSHGSSRTLHGRLGEEATENILSSLDESPPDGV
jgi:hypothetical protein